MSAILRELYRQLEQTVPGSPESTEISDKIVLEFINEYQLPTASGEALRTIGELAGIKRCEAAPYVVQEFQLPVKGLGGFRSWVRFIRNIIKDTIS